MIEIIKIIIIWILALFSFVIIGGAIGLAFNHYDNIEREKLQICLDKGVSFQECYSGLNIYQYWNNK